MSPPNPSTTPVPTLTTPPPRPLQLLSPCCPLSVPHGTLRTPNLPPNTRPSPRAPPDLPGSDPGASPNASEVSVATAWPRLLKGQGRRSGTSRERGTSSSGKGQAEVNPTQSFILGGW